MVCFTAVSETAQSMFGRTSAIDVTGVDEWLAPGGRRPSY